LVSRDVGAAAILTGSLADGVVEHPEDPLELESKLRNLVQQAKNPGWSEAARKLAEEYSWPNHFRKFEALLTEIIKPLADASVS
jgi:hypothetical protein